MSLLSQSELDAAEAQLLVALNIDDVLSSLASAGVDTSQINSVGTYMSFTFGPNAGLYSGTVILTVLADVNNPSNVEFYLTGEAGVGAIASISSLSDVSAYGSI